MDGMSGGIASNICGLCVYGRIEKVEEESYKSQLLKETKSQSVRDKANKSSKPPNSLNINIISIITSWHHSPVDTLYPAEAHSRKRRKDLKDHHHHHRPYMTDHGHDHHLARAVAWTLSD